MKSQLSAVHGTSCVVWGRPEEYIKAGVLVGLANAVVQTQLGYQFYCLLFPVRSSCFFLISVSAVLFPVCSRCFFFLAIDHFVDRIYVEQKESIGGQILLKYQNKIIPSS